ncbi:helix-turn-helix transcriptional regulator [Paenibacillus sp. HGF7]|uniref:helix-turn-helix domain-containing protein n=1 Tax=Paenibacillus sp. HGF7 TaxID=944559 RepID=UPI0032C4867A
MTDVLIDLFCDRETGRIRWFSESGDGLGPKITSIRTQLKSYLDRRQMTINQFAEVSGINSGTLSIILHGNRPIAMQQLDRMTAGMGLHEGHFYDVYIEECFFHSNPDWRRLGPLIHRCAELGKLDLLLRVVRLMLENLSYLPLLFETAEHFHSEGRREAAALLYECIAESEKYQHSERLALCQYRLFTLAIGDDLKANLRAATLFESYVPRLDVSDQLDALNQLAYVFGTLHEWEKVDTLAQELHRIAAIQYRLEPASEPGREAIKQPKRPLCYYILQALLIRSVVCEERGQFDQALHYVSLYAEPDWLREQSDEEKRIVEQFREWAVANTYLYRIMSGELMVLPEYINCIASRKDDIFTALCKIVQIANRYGYEIDDILDRFSSHLPYQTYQSEFGEYNKPVMKERYAQFLSDLAAYHLTQNRRKGIKFVLHGLEFSVRINSERNIIQCMALFERFRHLAGIEEKNEFKHLVNEVRLG